MIPTTCQGRVAVILGDCGSLDPGSNLGPGLFSDIRPFHRNERLISHILTPNLAVLITSIRISDRAARIRSGMKIIQKPFLGGFSRERCPICVPSGDREIGLFPPGYQWLQNPMPDMSLFLKTHRSIRGTCRRTPVDFNLRGEGVLPGAGEEHPVCCPPVCKDRPDGRDIPAQV